MRETLIAIITILGTILFVVTGGYTCYYLSYRHGTEIYPEEYGYVESLICHENKEIRVLTRPIIDDIWEDGKITRDEYRYLDKETDEYFYNQEMSNKKNSLRKKLGHCK